MPSEPTIDATCPCGDLTGLDRGATHVFKGIRYATAGRLEPPTIVTSWSGRLDATTYRAQAPQNPGPLEKMLGSGSLPMDEDCLFLNVFTPGCDDGRRPVLVWIHGGAFITGTGAMPWYDGSHLVVRGDVVVVTLNYRLGAFGFLGDSNLGTLDQAAALSWIRDNVGAFGGDPDNVTVFGQSAGGSSLIALMATTSASGLFHRAWAMSPSIVQLRTSAVGAALRDEFLGHLGRTASLETASTADVLRAQSMMSVHLAGLQQFAPTEGTDTIPGPILDVAARDPRPLVIGTTRDENLLFTAFDPSRVGWGDGDLRREFRRRFSSRADDAVAAYREHRPDARDANRLVSAMQTDELFRVPAQRLSSARSESGASTWMYQFDLASNAFGGILGSCHGIDIPFAFDNLHRPGTELFVGRGADRQPTADQFADAIVTFARSDDPGWPVYDTTTRATQRIGPEPVVVKDPEPELRQLWG